MDVNLDEVFTQEDLILPGVSPLGSWSNPSCDSRRRWIDELCYKYLATSSSEARGGQQFAVDYLGCILQPIVWMGGQALDPLRYSDFWGR